MSRGQGAARYLIVNADDFGQTSGVNAGIIRAHEQGIVTSASLMVRWPAAETAAAYGRGHPELSVGLHLDLGEWVYRDDDWVRRYEVVPADDAAAVRAEIAHQLDLFRRLVGRTPTHLDAHQHVHLSEPARSIVVAAARELGIPVRRLTPGIGYCGAFYGQSGRGEPYPDALTVESLLATLTALPQGVTELCCHPGTGDEPEMVYNAERAQEVRTLRDPRVRTALDAAGIALVSFHDVARLLPHQTP